MSLPDRMSDAIEERGLEVSLGSLLLAAGAAVLLLDTADFAAAILGVAGFGVLLLEAVDLALLLFAVAVLALLFGAGRVALGRLLIVAAGVLVLRDAVPPLPFFPAIFPLLLI